MHSCFFVRTKKKERKFMGGTLLVRCGITPFTTMPRPRHTTTLGSCLATPMQCPEDLFRQ